MLKPNIKFIRAFDNSEVETPDVGKRSADSAAMVPYWDKTDAINGGIKTMRDANDEFLPKFPKEPTEDYKFRLNTTKFTNVFRDIVENLASKPFEEEIEIVGDDKVPEEINEFAEDVDGENNLTVFAASTFYNGLNSAVDWIFIDYPDTSEVNIKTVADQKASGIKPFWVHVLGRNILAAETKMINGEEVLCLIRIFEPGKPDKIREFIRNDDGTVIWNLYHKNEKENTGEIEWVLEVGSKPVTIGVIPLVPFATGRRDGKTFRYFPALQDAADLQIELYQEESALKFAKILSAYPMLAGNGVTPEKDAEGNIVPISVGPKVVLYSPPNGKGDFGEWKYVQPDAAILKFLAENIKDTKLDLRELGRQPLTAQSGNLTVITTAVAAGKAKSAVGAWTLNLKDALQKALKITSLWMGIKGYEPEVSIFDDFDNLIDSETDVNSLIELYKENAISLKTLHKEFKRRGVLSSEFDHEMELKDLLDEIPDEEFEEEDDDKLAAQA